ncbi:copper resistance protein NlpE N-terminal domain-containing protein [Rheinheimera sediminis]|uniref:copper resistance protein NlpE N-terminal domain-containing protein n=1 Tax=Rheinheimera sp. YQF-1 TaxID=2499626 RepID=UPI00164536FC|nr:copper resistance protein NlpE N-terminal domain-containing protein [Rheinheimera sp. YQF-1]
MSKPLIFSLTAWLVLAACEPVPAEPPATVFTETTKVETVVEQHNSQNSLDWAGTYRGVLPCADCEGIDTLLTLNMDNSYLLSITYLGKETDTIQQQGSFEWDNTGSVVQLLHLKDGAALYKVGENQLFQLDIAGEIITGDLSDNYKLIKQNQPPQARLTGVRWTLSELMGQKVLTTEPDSTPYLEFSIDNRVDGFTGCNHFTGAYEAEGLRLRFKPLATTAKACLHTSVEEQFLSTIHGIDNYTLNDSGLAFYKARTAALARFTSKQLQP